MSMHIINSGLAGDSPSTSSSGRLQTKSGGNGNRFSAMVSASFDTVQKSLNGIGTSLNKAQGGSAGVVTAALAPKVTSAQNSPVIPPSHPTVPPTTGTGGGTPPGYPVLSIKSIYGETPAGLDRSGLSGIIDKSGHNLSNKEIADFFDGNPSTREIADMGLTLGLNQYQEARALAIWRGTSYAEPVWVPDGASTIGGSAGGEITGNGAPTIASGAWGNNPTSTSTNSYKDTVTLASSSPAKHFVA